MCKASVEYMVFEYTGDGCSVPKDVTSLIFKEGLQKIGKEAFRDCTSLKSVTLPSSVTEIGADAFERCGNLREIAFNDGLQKIGIWAFQNCSSLENITLPSTVTEIGHGAFYECSNLREFIFNEGLQKIEDYAFFDCTSLQSITLPSTVTEISNGAFSGCRNLREVELNGVPQLFNETFHNCDALERLLFSTISKRLENIIQTSHWEDLEDKLNLFLISWLNQVRGVVQWESNKLFVSTLTTRHHWNIVRRDFGRIARLVSYYEIKEATTTFGLALWKSKLDQADATNTTNRASYRIDVPGPVKDAILQYL